MAGVENQEHKNELLFQKFFLHADKFQKKFFGKARTKYLK